MTVKVGIIGRGFIGNMHLGALSKNAAADVVAIADKAPANLRGETGPGGNIAVDGDLSLEGISLYSSENDLLADPNVDAVLICLPTHLHKDMILKAINANKHILCEKPMALNSGEGREIVDTVRGFDKVFLVGHCIRLWPAYAKAAEIVRENSYGKVLYAMFTRHSPNPTWSANNWVLAEESGGGAILDLHIHDVDFVNYLFGRPDAMHVSGFQTDRQGIAQITATYSYPDGKEILIEGGWAHPPTYPFRMAFSMNLESATLEFDSRIDRNLHLHTAGGKELIPELVDGDGYTCEHDYFFKCIETGMKPELITAQSSLEAIELVEEERTMLG